MTEKTTFEITPPALVRLVGRTVKEWRVEQFGEQSLFRHLTQLVEEAGEAAEALLSGDLLDFRKELGDFYMALAAFYTITDQELDLATQKALLALRPTAIVHTGAWGSSVLCSLSKLARVIGKESEGIREETRGTLQEPLGELIVLAYVGASYLGEALQDLVAERVERMLSLNFRAPEEAKKSP